MHSHYVNKTLGFTPKLTIASYNISIRTSPPKREGRDIRTRAGVHRRVHPVHLPMNPKSPSCIFHDIYIYILYYYEPTKKIKSGSVTLNDPTAVPVKWSIKSILQPLLVLRGPTGHPERMLLALPVAPGGRPRRSQAPCAPWLSTSPVAWHSSPHHRTIAEGKKEEVWQTWLKRCYCIV